MKSVFVLFFKIRTVPSVQERKSSESRNDRGLSTPKQSSGGREERQSDAKRKGEEKQIGEERQSVFSLQTDQR